MSQYGYNTGDLSSASMLGADFRSKIDSGHVTIEDVLMAAGDELLYIMRNNDYSKLKTTGNVGKIINEIQCILENKK